MGHVSALGKEFLLALLQIAGVLEVCVYLAAIRKKVFSSYPPR
jgi:hypothetical protein